MTQSSDESVSQSSLQRERSHMTALLFAICALGLCNRQAVWNTLYCMCYVRKYLYSKLSEMCCGTWTAEAYHLINCTMTWKLIGWKLTEWKLRAKLRHCSVWNNVSLRKASIWHFNNVIPISVILSHMMECFISDTNQPTLQNITELIWSIILQLNQEITGLCLDVTKY